MPLDKTRAEEARGLYIREYDRYAKLARFVEARCTSLVRQVDIKATIQSRAKDPDSFHRKLVGYIQHGPQSKIDQVTVADDALAMVGDLAGVRVATYVEADRARVVELIRSNFRGPQPDGSVDVDEKKKESGYRATHCQVLLPEDLLASPDAFNLVGASAEVQVCSMLGHVWNEIEHDLRYKVQVEWGSEGALRDEYLRSLRESADQGDVDIQELLTLQSERIARVLTPLLAAELPQVPHFADNGVDVVSAFVRLGYTTMERIRATFLSDIDAAVSKGRALAGQHHVIVEVHEAPEELDLSSNNADVLLALLLETHRGDLVALFSQQLHVVEDSGDVQVAPRAARIAKFLYDLEPM